MVSVECTMYAAQKIVLQVCRPMYLLYLPRRTYVYRFKCWLLITSFMPEKKNLEVMNDNKSYIKNEDKLSIKQRQNDTPKETLRKHASRHTEE